MEVISSLRNDSLNGFSAPLKIKINGHINGFTTDTLTFQKLYKNKNKKKKQCLIKTKERGRKC